MRIGLKGNNWSMLRSNVLCAAIVFSIGSSYAQAIWGSSPITEPYPYVSTGSFSGPAVPLSPDPLVAYRWPAPQAADGLQIYLLKPKAVYTDAAASFDNIQSLTGATPYVTVKGTGSIRLDFGQENAAWLEFDSPDFSGTVEMSISEFNEPFKYPVKTLAPVKMGNTWRLELNDELYEGVRFAWIHVRTFSAQWHINGIRLVCQIKPANYNGSFSCSDTMLTKIWYVGAYGVKLNLLKDYYGAILMDRGDRFSWTGDAHPAQAASMVAFGNYDFVKRNIDFTASESNGIRSYSLYWVLSLVDYYNYTGDTAALRAYITNASAKLDDAYAVYGTNPGLMYYGWDERLGAGFEHPDIQESQNAYKMLSIRAWKEFATVMGTYGRTDLRDKYNGYAAAKINSLRQSATWYQTFGLHAGADAVTTGLLNANEKNAIFERSFIDRVNRISFSPFNQYFVIQAFALMNKYDDALSSVRDLWGGQIRYGGTTFFENYRTSWNSAVGMNGAVPNNQCGYTSLCHPWGSGITKWLSEEVLGIKPTSPGFATLDIIPHLGRTLTSVSGKTPTPRGDVRASFDVSSGNCSVSVPLGSVGRIGVPKAEKNISSITVNGALAWDGAFHAVAGIGNASQDSQFVYLTNVAPGAYTIFAVYNGTTPSYSEPAEIYPARCIGMDSTTGGDWGGVYGKEGYVLCNYNGNGSDKRSLPSYVSSVNYYMIWGNGLPNNTVWANATNDRRAPAPDAGNGVPRNAACLYTNDPVAVQNTFTVTVAVNGTREYRISLYFLDWDDKGRRIAVEMFDASTLNLVAPVSIVKSCRGGAYLTFVYNKSARFRIDPVRGDNGVLSGIFFDPGPVIGSNKNIGNSSENRGKITCNSRIVELSMTIEKPAAILSATIITFAGKSVRMLFKSTMSKGNHRVSFPVPDLPAGVYTIVVRQDRNVMAQKKIVVCR